MLVHLKVREDEANGLVSLLEDHYPHLAREIHVQTLNHKIRPVWSDTRSAPIRRKRTLPKRGKKMGQDGREMAKVLPLLLQRSEGRCEFPFATGPCAAPATDPHHRKPRSQGGTNELVNLLHVCRPHHEFIHRNPLQSYIHGWLVKQTTAEWLPVIPHQPVHPK